MSFEAHTNDVILRYDLVRYCMTMYAGGFLALHDTLKKAMIKAKQAIQRMALWTLGRCPYERRTWGNWVSTLLLIDYCVAFMRSSFAGS